MAWRKPIGTCNWKPACHSWYWPLNKVCKAFWKFCTGPGNGLGFESNWLPKPTNRYLPLASKRGNKKLRAAINSSSRCLIFHFWRRSSAPAQAFGLQVVPVEIQARRRRLVGRAYQPAVRGRETHQIAQAILGAE